MPQRPRNPNAIKRPDFHRPFDQMYTVNAETECWEWHGRRFQGGYSQHWDSNTNNYVSARRWAWQRIHTTPLSDHQRLKSTCENILCVNPAHLKAKQETFRDENYTPRGPRPHTAGLRPHLWKTGSDPLRHRQYRVWLQQRNQAQWREEGWVYEFEDWQRVWAPLWSQRGKASTQLCMTRLDPTKPWSEANTQIVTRHEHSSHRQSMRKQKKEIP